jgi:hypothetical protein
MMTLRRTPLICLAAAFAAAGCSAIGSPGKTKAAVALPVLAPTTSPFDLLTADLHPVTNGGSDVSSAVKALGTAELRVRNDGAVEYWLRIENPARITYTTAQLYRRSAQSSGEPVATIFTGAAISDPSIQVRGTISGRQSMQPGELADELREQPGEFHVVLVPSEGQGTPLRGEFRHGRR